MFGTASRWLLIPLTLLLFSSTARGADTLCDPATSNCRTQVLTLIQNERVGIDVGFWFMQDSRYMVEIVKRRQAGVPVRILMDPRASVDYAGNDTMLAGFAQAGIPMRKRIASGIQHWKMMLFAGQNTVQFGSANYSPDAFVPSVPYTNYVSETVFVTDDPAVVNSFKTKFDDWWTDTVSIANYANITAPLARVYPTYPIDPSMNFPPQQDYASRAVGRYNAESLKIDVIMFRITDQRHTNAMIAAHNRGVPVRMIVDIGEYRQPARLWDSWNVDRLYMAGIPLRWQGHAGDNHEKLVLLYGQNMTIFGSSNWTTASANSQQEHNYFTTKNAIFQWFAAQFDRMWNNDVAVETAPFVPLPPDAPKNKLPAAGSQLPAGTTAKLTWFGGPWAHNYDVYFGTTPTPPLVAANLNLGPSLTTTTNQSYTTPVLAAGTTYYWRIVSKTMANLSAPGPVWSFTTPAVQPGPLPSGWSASDIGAVGVPGVSSSQGGTFTVAGSGADVWGTADAFRYTYQSLTGDGQIVARVASLAPVNSWSKAGVMIRNSLAANSAYAFMIISVAKGSVFQYRASTGASAASIAGTAVAPPYWVRIVRSGNTITGYQSANGSSWTLVGSASIPMGQTVQIGLAVTSHDNTRLATATFDQISR
jgi:phosphatidylserine/phosphatidylglycerophosphate/cardiolipin synthase-like enzyme/regulation of enolase protein 1 (concanavalin A-like superfamily)